LFSPSQKHWTSVIVSKAALECQELRYGRREGEYQETRQRVCGAVRKIANQEDKLVNASQKSDISSESLPYLVFSGG
jgi:hypothetical protein